MLYHKDVFWKNSFNKDSATLIKSVNRISRHLQEYLEYSTAERRNFDLDGIMNVTKALKKMDSVQAFEVETEKGKLTKCVVRVSYNNRKDICLVFRYGLVITAWLCSKDDNHKTLDKSRYARY